MTWEGVEGGGLLLRGVRGEDVILSGIRRIRIRNTAIAIITIRGTTSMRTTTNIINITLRVRGGINGSRSTK